MSAAVVISRPQITGRCYAGDSWLAGDQSALAEQLCHGVGRDAVALDGPVVIVLDEVAEEAVVGDEWRKDRPQRQVHDAKAVGDLTEEAIGGIRTTLTAVEAALVSIALPVRRVKLAPIGDADDDEWHAHRVGAVAQPLEDSVGDTPAALPFAIWAGVELAARRFSKAVDGVPGLAQVLAKIGLRARRRRDKPELSVAAKV